MSKKQFYGLKYPFTSQDIEHYYLDVNKDMKSKVKSLLMHVVFTPKGQKIRDVNFGTNLVKFIFDPSDDYTFENIKKEVMDAVTYYIPRIRVNDLQILQNEEDMSDVLVRIDYTVLNGINNENDTLITKL